MDASRILAGLFAKKPTATNDALGIVQANDDLSYWAPTLEIAINIQPAVIQLHGADLSAGHIADICLDYAEALVEEFQKRQQ